VNESLMTGEPFPASKSEEPCIAVLPAEARNALFSGTSVIAGHGTMLVVETGSRTRFGAIATALAANVPPTALENGVRRLGYLIVRLTLFLTLFVLLAHLAAGRPPLQSFLFAVALAVGLTPELLPMVMTVTLARGAQRMAARQVIVRQLSAIHDFGAMDVLCVDKTGTLTEAKISLAMHIDSEGRPHEPLLEYAYINARFQSGVRSPLDEAILQAGQEVDASSWTRKDELAFDFSRRCLSVSATRNNEPLMITKGAPEAILARAVAAEVDGLARPLDVARRQRIDALQERYNREGYRLLAVAVKILPVGQGRLSREDESDLTLIGFCVFTDPVKTDAAAAVAELTALGVNLKIISGDQPGVVQHVAAAVGLPSDRVLTGTDIAGLTDSGLAAQTEGISFFARVDPEQKKRVIEALRLHGHVVGFLGDGVNDAPAIHAAHVGLSVDGATEVARAAADMILLAADLAVLAAGVREGRRTLANILKYVRMGTSSNFGNMLSMALASVVLPFLPLLPFQILLNNLLYDLSEIGIPFDDVDNEDVASPHTWNMSDILHFTLIMGAISSLFDAATFLVLVKGFHANETLFQTGWFLESITTQILVIFLIRSSRLRWRTSRPNAVLVATSLGALATALFVVVGPYRAWFGFTELTWPVAAMIAGVTVSYLMAAEAGKHLALAVSKHPVLIQRQTFGDNRRSFLRKIIALGRTPIP
jgi:Mg2+-importing ATPase